MSRSSFARSVARAAASGGSKSYRARRPAAWYLLISVIVILGIGLIVYSRNEKNSSSASTQSGPTATDHWDVALGIDLCGSLQPALAPSSNITTVGIRTFGNGLIDINPGAVTNSSKYLGSKATLGLFASSYTGFKLTNSSIEIPGKLPVTWVNGASCSGPLHGKGTLVAKVWSSPTASPTTITTNLTGIRLKNDEMITLAFVPAGAAIPEPASKSTLISTVAQNATIGTIATTTTTTTIAPASTTTTTIASSTTTTTKSTAGVPGESATTSTTTPASAG